MVRLQKPIRICKQPVSLEFICSGGVKVAISLLNIIFVARDLESLWNHGLTIILVSSLSSRIMGLTYDYAVDMSGAGSNLLAGSRVLWAC